MRLMMESAKCRSSRGRERLRRPPRQLASHRQHLTSQQNLRNGRSFIGVTRQEFLEVRDEGRYEGFEGANRKAISLVVATVVLVLISVVASAILWFWVSNFTSASTAQQPALNERIKIEAVEVSGDDVKVYVRNVDSVATTIH
jgi:hypothetical protein